MAHDMLVNSRFFLGKHLTAIRDVHREICGENDVTASLLDRFVGGLIDDDPGPGWGLAVGIAIGKAQTPTVAAEYRRFLDNGRNCPEGSPGFARQTASRDPLLHATPEGLRDPERRTAFMAAVGAIGDPATFARAWEDYVIAVMQIARQALPELEALAKREAAGDLPPAEEVQKMIRPMEDAFYVSAAFTRDGADAFGASWEKALVDAARAKFGNTFNTILPYLGLVEAGNPRGNAIGRIVQNVGIFFEPFDHLHYSFSSVYKSRMRTFLEVETAEHSLAISPANPIALRQLVDTIVLEAGRVRKEGAANRIRIAWDEGTRTISFTDIGEGTLAFEAFADPRGEDAKVLTVLADLVGPGNAIRFDADPETKRLTSISVVVPKGDAAAPALARPAAASAETASAPKRFTGVVDALDEATRRMIAGNFVRAVRSAWTMADEREQAAAIANLATHAEEVGIDASALDDVVYRAAFTSAVSGAPMSSVLLR